MPGSPPLKIQVKAFLSVPHQDSWISMVHEKTHESSGFNTSTLPVHFYGLVYIDFVIEKEEYSS
jgi:hypothetical protein